MGDERSTSGTATPGPRLTVLVSGASGMIGSELVRQLTEDGHEVHKLVRRSPRSADEHHWAPASGELDAALMDSVDAVVNLSGASLGRIPWTTPYRRTILDSRVQTTAALAAAISRAAKPPAVFLSASAVGIYGDRPAVRLADDAERGSGFLSDVVQQWEDAASSVPDSVRVVHLRTGIVVGRGGGALGPLLLVTRLGLGARVGTGGQHWPWISLHDEAAAIRHLLGSTLTGPVNLAGPVPATSDRITSYLARRLHRWYSFVLPERLISIGMGDAGRELLLASQKVLPTALADDGFDFRHRTVEQAIDALLDRE